MFENKKIGVVLTAGGRGKRLGASVPKQLLEIGGSPLFLYPIQTFLKHLAIDQLVLVVPVGMKSEFENQTKDFDVKIVEGGAERYDSVRNGIQALDDDVDWVLVHDAARPFVSKDVIDRILNALKEGPCIAALPCSDTVKVVSDQKIQNTLDRKQIWLAQTPQAFAKKDMLQVYEKMGTTPIATDEAGQLESAGFSVSVVLGSIENDKITTKEDLERFRKWAGSQND